MPETSQIDSYYAAAYWRPRKESAEECARRAEIFLEAVAKIDPSFSQWFRQGKSRKDALKRPIEPHRAALEKLIRQGRDRQFEDLGYSVWAWNGVGVDYDDCGLHIDCGCYAESGRNVCVIKLPTRGPNSERVLTAPVLSKLVWSMVLAWEPDSAIATSAMHRETVTQTATVGTFVGWVMYLPRSRGTVPPLPAPVRIEPVEDRGTLIILTPERLTADNREHLALSQQVQALLDKAGLLAPALT